MARGIILAMEEYEGGVDDGQEVDAAELASDTIETSDTAGEIIDEAEGVESAADDANTVGEIRDQMEESVEEGEGMDETSAEIAEVAIEALASRLGYPYYGRVLPAKESFGGRTSRIQATRLAIEKADNIFVRAWDAIVKTVKKIINKIVGFFRKLFDSASKQNKAISKMKVEYGDKVVSPAFESSVAKNMGGSKNVNEVIKFIDSHADFISNGMSDINTKAKDLLKKAKEAAKKFGKEKEKNRNGDEIRNVVKGILDDFEKIITDMDVTGKVNDGFMLWGGRSLHVNVFATSSARGEDNVSKEGKGHFFSVEFKNNSKLDTSEGGKSTVEAWNSSNGSKFKASAVKLSDAVVTYTKESRKFEDLQKEIMNTVDDLKSLGDDSKGGDDDKDSKKAFEKMVSTMRTMIVDVTNFVSKVNAAVLSSANSTVSGVLTINSENAKCWSKK